MTLRAFNSLVPQLKRDVYIDPAALVIGQITLGDDVSIWPMSVVRGDVNYIKIGEQTNIQDGCILHVTHAGPYSPEGGALVIGKRVTVGHGVILHACNIGDAVLIGMGSRILDNAVIEPYSMLGAGSLLPPGKTIPSGELWIGSPAVKHRDLTLKEKEFLDYSAGHYVKLKNRYLTELSL